MDELIAVIKAVFMLYIIMVAVFWNVAAWMDEENPHKSSAMALAWTAAVVAFAKVMSL